MPTQETPFDQETRRRLAHYSEQAEGAKAIAARRQAAFNELVDFVEQHGGALSGEQRGTLWTLFAQ